MGRITDKRQIILSALSRLVKADFKTAKKKFMEQGFEEEEVTKYLTFFKSLRDQNKIKDKVDKNIDLWPKRGFEEFKTFVDDTAIKLNRKVKLDTDTEELVKKALKAPIKEEHWGKAKHDIKKDELFWGKDSGSTVDKWLHTQSDMFIPPEYVYTIRVDGKIVAWSAVGEYQGFEKEKVGNLNAFVLRKYRKQGLASKVATEAIIKTDHNEVTCFPNQFPLGCKLIKKHGRQLVQF